MELGLPSIVRFALETESGIILIDRQFYSPLAGRYAIGYFYVFERVILGVSLSGKRTLILSLHKK